MESRSAKTQRQVGSAVLTQCRLFGLEGAMTDPAHNRDRILTMETIVLRQHLLAVPQVHESTVADMSVIGHPAGNVCKVHIYTDGSFNNAEGDAAEEAAWAFVVILEHSCAEYSFHGFAAGALAVGSEGASPLAWVGAIKAGCDTAELAAITRACRWCIYRMRVERSMCGLLVVLNVDSQYAIDTCVLLSTVRQYILRELPNVFWSLFPGHCGVDCWAHWTSVERAGSFP